MSFVDWIIGFTEAEGCFTNNKEYPQFCISQNDRQILEKIKQFFEVGNVYLNGNNWQYKVIGSDCWYIRSFFENKLILDKKKIQFENWKQLKWPYFAYELQEIQQKFNFEHWLLGFIEGEGSFCSSNGDYPIFSISQDEYGIIEKIKEFFGTGHIYKDVANSWQYRTNGTYCNVIRDFCEGRLQAMDKIEQFEKWKEFKWRDYPSNVRVCDNSIHVSFKTKHGIAKNYIYAE